MQNLVIAKDHVTEGRATDIILFACRANEARKDWECKTYKVKFYLLADGSHEAVLKDADGVNIAIAIVDKFDV